MMYPMNLEHFEQLVETEYPDIDLNVEMTTTAAMNGDSERRLRNGHGTDLVVTTNRGGRRLRHGFKCGDSGYRLSGQCKQSSHD